MLKEYKKYPSDLKTADTCLTLSGGTDAAPEG